MSFDKIYADLVLAIKEKGILQNPDEVRAHYADGEPAPAYAIEGVSFKITPDMGLPILKSKFVGSKWAFTELEWIWQAMSNDVKWLQERGVTIWNEWAHSVRDNTLCYVAPITYTGVHSGEHLEKVSYAPIVTGSFATKSSTNCGDYNILSKDYKNNKYKIQFLNTGYITEVTQSQASRGDVKDYYARSVNNVGYYGDYKKSELLNGLGKYHKRWVAIWENMIRRCSSNYKGQWEEYKEVYVSSEFQSCENFLTWVLANKPEEDKLLGTLQLDKDYYGSNVYSPMTCTLLSPKENTGLTLDAWYLFDNKVFTSKLSFANYVHQVTKGEFGLTPKGRVSTTLDIFMQESFDNGRLQIINPKELNSEGYPRFSLKWGSTINKAYGWQLRHKKRFVEGCNMNQVEYVIHQLKNNPSSRRIMTTLWDVEDLDDMALEPCVWATHWTVQNGKLNLHVKQRSSDCCLGLPFNILQYHALHVVMAKVSDLELGTMFWNIDNAHIYDRHMEQAIKQVTAPMSDEVLNAEPKLVLPWEEADMTNFFECPLSELKVEGYKHNGRFNYEVAI